MYKNLRDFRESLNMTQKEFAASINLSLSTYNGYETGSREPKSDFWITIAQKYGVTIDYLMGFSNDPRKISDAPTPALSEDALQVARDYADLDWPGQRVVKVVIADQQARVREERKKARRILPDNVIPLQISRQPASAGTGVYLGPEEMETIYVLENDLTRRASFCVPVRGDSMEPLYHDGDILLIEGRWDVLVGQIGVFTIDGDGYVKRRGDGELLSINPAYNHPIPLTDDSRCNGLVIGIIDSSWIVKG